MTWLRRFLARWLGNHNPHAPPNPGPPPDYPYTTADLMRLHIQEQAMIHQELYRAVVQELYHSQRTLH